MRARCRRPEAETRDVSGGELVAMEVRSEKKSREEQIKDWRAAMDDGATTRDVQATETRQRKAGDSQMEATTQ
ncbi:hypothetical protein AHAS_Ahas05G0002000 [Arachis hypogaea]